MCNLEKKVQRSILFFNARLVAVELVDMASMKFGNGNKTCIYTTGCMLANEQAIKQ